MPKYYTTAEVAEMLGFVQPTVQRWCRLGLIEYLKVGNDLRISEDAVIEFIERNTKKVRRRNGK